LDDLVLAEARRLRERGPHLNISVVSAARVLGQRSSLDRVARNLLDNAARHAATTVTVQLTSTEDLVRLIVRDDGPGIADADRERVFDRFTRLDDARSTDQGGAGLGLAIVRDVVRSYGGQVTITDNNPGAVFTVTLPAAP
ncbi:MAG: ATP-binding protein, partial [Actinomycetota bacterium]|nr:ATP-binding protein [Actinomycetota bacterium]